MRALARKRLQREYPKRAAVARPEKLRRMLRFVELTCEDRANQLRLAFWIFRQQRQGRVAYCRHHCYLTGRGRSVYRAFRLNRNLVRVLAHQGHIYGLRKASW
jgi:small subunit ribosomal protein S14